MAGTIDNTTIISIAHRLTTLQNCDEIIVIEKGKIAQRGTFDELSDTPGIFQDMKNGGTLEKSRFYCRISRRGEFQIVL